MPTPILEVSNLRVEHVVRQGPFRRRTGAVHAVDGLSISLVQGEALGIAGESGSGKTTLARVLVGLQQVTAGDVRLFGELLPTGDWPLELRKRVQMVFQDASGFLDPRQPVIQSLLEPLSELSGLPTNEHKEAAYRLLERVGLDSSFAERLPHELSGGQRQRIAIARALAANPALIVLDEPTSALDVSVQAQILNLLDELRTEQGISYVLISHDLNVIAHLCDRVAVMYLGRAVESGDVAQIFQRPEHPYTKALLSAIPDPDPTKPWEPLTLMGEVATSRKETAGCPFHPRCPMATDVCRVETPPTRTIGQVAVACHFAGDGEAGQASIPLVEEETSSETGC